MCRHLASVFLLGVVLAGATARAHEVDAVPDAGSVPRSESAGSSETQDETDAGSPQPHAEPPKYETVVSGRRPYTAASASVVRNEDFATRPISDPSDILEVTPGLFTVQHAGGGKANQYFLRGFDIDHGTDLALSIDGVPINMVSHGHGQGYADLHFVIPEAVEKLEVTKGPYAAENGDFATAGAANLVTKRAFGESEASLSYGSFNTFRALLVGAPNIEGDFQSYLVGEVYGTNGPFLSPERMRRLNLIGRASYNPSPQTEIALQLMSYGSGWNASGQIPLRAVEAGTLDRFGSIDPTEGGNSQRHSASLSFHHHDAGGGEVKVLVYAVRYRLNLFSNFTFFANDSVNGDQIEQADSRTVSGFQAEYQKSANLGGISFKTTGGLRLRNDDIDNGLFHTIHRERLEKRVDAQVSEGSLGLFLEEDTEWTHWLRSVVGLRTDYFGFQVSDRLEDLSAAGNRSSGTSQALFLSPKASVVLTPIDLLDVYLNFGRGFHSNDARGVVREVEPVTPLAAATGYEVGLRVRPARGLDVAAAAWALDLDSEIVWVGDEGTTEARPATTRRGLEVEVRYRFNRWLRADADLTWTRARFRGVSTDANLVPLAPIWTWAGGLRVDHPIGIFGSVRIQGLSNRPANEDGSLMAQGFTLVDLEAGYQTKRLRFALDVRNLFNVHWRQAQFANESRLPGEAEPVSDLHFTPGYPISVTGTASLFF